MWIYAAAFIAAWTLALFLALALCRSGRQADDLAAQRLIELHDRHKDRP